MRIFWTGKSTKKEYERLESDKVIVLDRSFSEQDIDGEYVISKPNNVDVKEFFSVLMHDKEWNKLKIGDVLYHRVKSSKGKKGVRKVEIIALPTRNKYAKQTVKLIDKE